MASLDLSIYSAFVSAGVSPELARNAERQLEQEFARASDRIRADLKEQSFTKLDGAELKTEIAHLRKDLADAMRQQTNWLTGVVLATAGFVLAVLKFM
jgi:hypothetical protein